MQLDLEFGEDGIAKLYKKDDPAGAERKTVFNVMTLSNYYRDLNEVVALASDPPAKTLAFRRLKLLEVRTHTHMHSTTGVMCTICTSLHV